MLVTQRPENSFPSRAALWPPPSSSSQLASSAPWPAEYASTASICPRALLHRTEERWIRMKCVWDHTWDLSRSGFRQLWAAVASAAAAGCCFPSLSAAWGWVAPSKPSHHHLQVDRPARTQFLWYNSPGDATLWNSLVLLLLHCVVYASTFFSSYLFFFFRSVTDPWSLSQPHNSR